MDSPSSAAASGSSATSELLDRVFRFESAWKAAVSGGPRPRLEDHLAGIPAPELPQLLRDLLTVDLAYRRQLREHPAPEEYQDRLPEHLALIRSVLAASSDSVMSETRSFTADTREPSTVTASAPVVGGLPVAIGRYRVVERLGGGGQAQAYRAVHPALPGRDVVVKWSNAALPQQSQDMLLAEGAVLAQLEDPGLARVYDADVCEGRPFLVMEYVPGRTLQQLLQEGPLPPRKAAALVAEVAGTMERIHRRGVLHRDLKPANVLLDASGRPRVLDFGLAWLESPWGTTGASRDGISGTFAYMAPEQANAQADRLGPRTDVFALGAVLYALLTARAPYQARDFMELWEQARQVKITPPRLLNPRLPRALERICLKAMAAEPQDRYGSAAEMEKDLRAYARRPRLLAAGLGLGVTLAAAALIVALARPSGPPTTSPTAAQPSAQVKPVSVDSLEVIHYPRHDGLTSAPVGNDRPAADFDDDVRVKVRFSEPAYSYLIALNADGKEQLCDPASERTAPPAQDRIDYPSDPQTAFSLNDSKAGGLQAFLVVAAARRLPAYAEWRARLGPSPWKHVEAGGAWWYDGQELKPCRQERGVVRPLPPGLQPLLETCRRFGETADVDAVQAKAFAVRPERAAAKPEGHR